MLQRFLCSAMMAGALAASAPAQTKLLRFPDIHGNQVVFTYGGDLWTASTSGGTATRLTAHPGLELFGKFSPDGKSIAFTGQYDGDEQVYVIPASGGEPRQLTFYPARGPLAPRWGYDNQVYGWTNDGKRVIFRSLRDGWFNAFSRLYTVAMEGGPAEPLPMPNSGAGSFSPAGNRIAYSPQARDFRTELRYGGGQANQLYIFDVETHDAKKISEGDRASRDPMWVGNTIYFDSDRDGHFNLYGYDVAGGKTSQLTTNKTYDLRWPSTDRESRIIYELNGELQIFDVKSHKITPLSISVPTDGLARRPSRVNAGSLIEQYELSPKGERAVFAARGDIFSVPIEKGPVRNLTDSSGVHDKWPVWSPDGARIAYISDKTGEEQIWVIGQDGAGKPEQITDGLKAFLSRPKWSPDSKSIAFSDQTGRLLVVTVADHKIKEIAKDTKGGIFDYEWSPRGDFLAFSMNHPSGFSSLYIASPDGQLHPVSSEFFNSGNPAWDPDGNYLYFISNHEFSPVISSSEFDYATAREAEIYALALRKDVKNPFAPESDEAAVAKDSDAKKDDKKDDKPADLKIDFGGIEHRVARVPLEAGNYGALMAKSGHLIYATYGTGYYGRAPETKTSLRIYSLKDRKETTLVDDFSGLAISGDGSKLLVYTNSGYSLMDATPTGASAKKTVATNGMYVNRVPADEWNEVFNEVWRRYRDFFYVPNMHGFDWEALRKEYQPLLQYATHRTDVTYVISEMISELTVQHAYVEGGDFEIPPRPRAALPGARFELDKASNRFRISKIFDGQNEEDAYRSPLTEIGVDVKVGDYVLAINGHDLNGSDDPYRLLRNADSPVQWLVNTTPSAEGARTIAYRPVANEQKLIYLDWVAANRRRVDEMSGGRIGYLHVPDMGADGIYEFIKWYYPQIDKDALIIDDRANGGGNVSRMLIARLSKRVLAAQWGRTVDEPALYPEAFIGPMATLLDGNSASDGDIFPAMFRAAGLGVLIGKRSWGGVVGIGDHGQLIDGGHVNVPEFGFTNAKGDWIIEGHGVDPDIEVDNDPASLIQGKDPQLERAVAELMKKLKDNPPQRPTRPAAPVKAK